MSNRFAFCMQREEGIGKTGRKQTANNSLALCLTSGCLPFPSETGIGEPELLPLHRFLLEQNVLVHCALVFSAPFQTVLEISHGANNK